MKNEPKDLFLLEGISLLCFNKNFTQCALSKRDNNVYIYEIKNLLDPKTWVQKDILSIHQLYVSGLDWNHNTNRILTCSYDKTSYVWINDGKKWNPENVVRTLKMGYLACKWSIKGDKFVEGTSSKETLVGYYSASSKWWTSMKIKSGHKSSVTTVDFDPTSMYVLSGSTDMKVLIASAYISEIDGDSLKGTVPDFGTVIYTFDANSWICNVKWSPSGALAFASTQNANVSVIDYKNQKVETINIRSCPIDRIIPISDTEIYCVGYNRHIYDYQKEGENWTMKKDITRLDSKAEKPKTSGTGSSFGGVAEQLKKYSAKGMVKKESLAVKTEIISYLHNTTISSVTIKDGQLITTDLAGFVKFWKI